MSRKRTQVVARRQADDNHEVVSVEGSGGFRREPCAECPWRTDQVGRFPAEAFALSAHTAYDMSQRTFACHMTGIEHPTTCAGFMLRGAEHNLAMRVHWAQGDIDPAAVTSSVELFDSYRAMAVANGVDPDDPVLTRCRP